MDCQLMSCAKGADMITRWGFAGLLGLIVLGGGLASAQEWSTLQNTATPGNGAELDVSGYHSVSIVVEMASTGTVQFKVKGDGSYANLACTDLSDAAGGLVTSVTASKNLVCSTGGMTKIQTPIAAAGGNITVKAKVSNVIVSRGGGGGGGGGGITTDIQDGAGDSVMDAVNNAVRVNIIAGAGSGGTAMTDDAAFTPGTTSVTPAGAMFDDVTPDSVNEGDGGVLRMSANRNLYTTIRDAAGNERGVNVDANGEIGIGAVRTSVTPGTSAAHLGKAEDAAHTTGDTGVAALSKRTDTAASSAGTDGDYATLNTDSTGRLWTNTEMPDAAALADNTSNPTVPGVAAFLMCYDGSTWDRCQGGLTDTDDGTIAAAQVPSISLSLPYAFNGTDWKRAVADPCGTLAKTYLPINITTATTTEITPSLAGASTHYYVCSVNIGPVAGAQNVALVDDDSDGCGTVTSGLAGGTTAGSGWNIAANGGIVLGNGASSVARTGGTNRVLCLVTSAAVQTSGVITVVAAP